jgi:hypothetical protein
MKSREEFYGPGVYERLKGVSDEEYARLIDTVKVKPAPRVENFYSKSRSTPRSFPSPARSINGPALDGDRLLNEVVRLRMAWKGGDR